MNEGNAIWTFVRGITEALIFRCLYRSDKSADRFFLRFNILSGNTILNQNFHSLLLSLQRTQVDMTRNLHVAGQLSKLSLSSTIREMKARRALPPHLRRRIVIRNPP
jgi:hypothetical protein